MSDVLSKGARSALMARIRGNDTKPELIVRRTLHAMGYRYRLHVGDLPGTPDLVFPSRRKVVFVNGCFWHAHECRHGLRRPSTNVEFWNAKALANRERDARVERALREAGWDVEVVWECETKSKDRPWLRRIVQWLGPSSSSAKADISAGSGDSSGPRLESGPS
ncbi:MAG: very short patch repair endonuclease [Thauera sp.]|nr:very short patch repair endonuclease [Thauera sp.]